MRICQLFPLCAICLLALTSTVFASETPLFPFVISADTPDNASNASRWIEAPAGKNGLIRVKDGQFHNDKGRVLFWGTNLCFDACFPSHEDSERLAARVARLGFNSIRLHHIDARDIWGDSWGKRSKNLTTIDPQQLEKLDYLIYQFKKHGIYVNINLHVSRWFDERDGFSGKDDRPKYDKGLDNFYPPFIELQKKYARDYLTHVNPYTKAAYIDEPSVCLVEINNENSIVRQWVSGNSLETMPDPYAAEYRRQWNEFLRKKYKSTATMKQAWNCRDFPFGTEKLKNDAKGFWKLNVSGGSKATLSQENENLKIKVEQTGKDAWIPQLIGGDFDLEKGMVYTVAFRMKADKKHSISCGVKRNHEPWTNLGLSQKLDLDKNWKEFSFQFLADDSDAKTRIDFSSFQPGSYEIAGLSLRPGGILGPKADQTLEDGTIPTIHRGSSSFPPQASNDFCEFLIDVEQKYWVGMYRFLNDELKVKQPISGTQLNYGSTVVQSELDYCDIHAYWNHPTFPRKSWDRKDWYMRNRALVNSANRDIFGHLATRRVAGKPYTVSEYDHPFPNQFAAEGLPMIAAFGRFQRWDGVFHFTYGNSSDKSIDRQTSYFNINANTVQLAHNPACHAIFCRGDAAEGKTVQTADWSPARELALLQEKKSTTNFNFNGLGLDMRLALQYPTALKIVGNDKSVSKIYPAIREDLKRFQSETKELTWDMNKEGKGFFYLDTPNSKIFTGFAEDGEKHTIGDIEIRIGKTRLGWSTISLVSVDGNGFGKPKTGTETRILVAATGLMQNTGMKLQHLDGDKITLSDQWGNAPVLCEGISAALMFKNIDSSKVRFFPLDEKGDRRNAVSIKPSNDGFVAELSPEHKTIWYEIVIGP